MLKAKLENTFEKFSTEWLKIRELGKVDRETIRKIKSGYFAFYWQNACYRFDG
jgi:hypothetical protein